MISSRRSLRLLVTLLVPALFTSSLAGFTVHTPAPLAGCGLDWEQPCPPGNYCNINFYTICNGWPDKICQANGEGESEEEEVSSGT